MKKIRISVLHETLNSVSKMNFEFNQKPTSNSINLWKLLTFVVKYGFFIISLFPGETF